MGSIGFTGFFFFSGLGAQEETLSHSAVQSWTKGRKSGQHGLRRRGICNKNLLQIQICSWKPNNDPLSPECQVLQQLNPPGLVPDARENTQGLSWNPEIPQPSPWLFGFLRLFTLLALRSIARVRWANASGGENRVRPRPSCKASAAQAQMSHQAQPPGGNKKPVLKPSCLCGNTRTLLELAVRSAPSSEAEIEQPLQSFAPESNLFRTLQS